ncbi:MAG: cytochrome c [Candidatus Latescibacterota bacterium]|nr:cytochrome c [Candidatus Latescibacterota bacterium]
MRLYGTSTLSGPLFWLAAVVVSAAPSHAQIAMKGATSEGRVLFHSPALSTNGLSCIDCHADFDEGRMGDGRIRAGHSLYGAASRQTFWGQEPGDPFRYMDITEAAVTCVKRFMLNPEQLTTEQVLSLGAYLKSINRRPSIAPLALSPAPDRTGVYADFEGGDRIKGRKLFYAACHACHPNGNSGVASALPRDEDPSFYARKIREGDGLGLLFAGIDPDAYDEESEMFMPFFGADRLSNEQIRHIVAYIKSLPPPTP